MALALLLLLFVWSLTNPIFASPDEPAHIVRAQGFSNFDFSPPFTTDGIPEDAIDCLRFNPDVTAACMNLSWGEPTSSLDNSTQGYPPLMYVIGAIPNLVLNGITASYATRLWLAITNVSLFAWSIALARRRGVWVAAGLLIGMTPLVTFTMANVNPSGLSAAGAMLLVSGLLTRPERITRNVREWSPIVVGLLVLALTRRDGAFWGAVIVAVMATRSSLDNVRRVVKSVIRSPRAVATTIVISFAGLAWAAPWMLRFVRSRATAPHSTWQATRATRIYLDHLIGKFGWLDSTMGLEPFYLALTVIGVFLFLAVVTSNRNSRRAILIALVTLAVVPIVFGTFRYPYFQGRYLIPGWIALMALAGDAIQSSSAELLRLGIRARRLLALWVVVHVWSLLNNLKRYATGRNGTWRMFGPDAWHPPMMSNEIAVVLIMTAGLVALLSIRRFESQESTTPPQASAPTTG